MNKKERLKYILEFSIFMFMFILFTVSLITVLTVSRDYISSGWRIGIATLLAISIVYFIGMVIRVLCNVSIKSYNSFANYNSLSQGIVCVVTIIFLIIILIITLLYSFNTPGINKPVIINYVILVLAGAVSPMLMIVWGIYSKKDKFNKENEPKFILYDGVYEYKSYKEIVISDTINEVHLSKIEKFVIKNNSTNLAQYVSTIVIDGFKIREISRENYYPIEPDELLVIDIKGVGLEKYRENEKGKYVGVAIIYKNNQGAHYITKLMLTKDGDLIKVTGLFDNELCSKNIMEKLKVNLVARQESRNFDIMVEQNGIDDIDLLIN